MPITDYHMLVVEDDIDAIESVKTACPPSNVTFSVVDPAHSMDRLYVHGKVSERAGRRAVAFVDLNYRLRKKGGESLDIYGGDVVKQWAAWVADGQLDGLEAICVCTSHTSLIDPRNPDMKLRRANPALKVFGLEKQGLYGNQVLQWLAAYDAGNPGEQLNAR